MLDARGKAHQISSEGKETFTFLARGFVFKGTLTFDGTVRIDGFVTGEIQSTGTVMLGEHAVVEGDIRAGTIVSSGIITGNVRATGKVHLLPNAVLRGDVKAPLVQMDEGVSFHGTCEADGRVDNQRADALRTGVSSVPTVRVAHREETGSVR